jgi:hypothetical protein
MRTAFDPRCSKVWSFSLPQLGAANKMRFAAVTSHCSQPSADFSLLRYGARWWPTTQLQPRHGFLHLPNAPHMLQERQLRASILGKQPTVDREKSL